MATITRKLEFDYGHRVLGHEGKCKNLHGHRGVVEISVHAPELDDIGRVVDFGSIKQLIGGWIDENWDHNLILHPDDSILYFPNADQDKIIGRKPYIMPRGRNPTAENLAEELYRISVQLITEKWRETDYTKFGGDCDPQLRVLSVRFWETPNSCAIYPDQVR